MLIILSACRIDQVHGGYIAFAAICCRHATQTADGQGPGRETTIGERPYHHVERHVVATHDHHVRRARGTTNQCYLDLAVGVEHRCERFDLEKTVRLRETGYCSRAFAGGECNCPVLALNQ